MKALSLSILALGAALAPLTAAEGDAAPASDDYVVVTVDGTEIKMSDVAARFQQRTGRPLASLTDEERAEFLATSANQVTEELVAETLLAAKAAEEDVAVAPAEVDAAEASLLSRKPPEMSAEEYFQQIGQSREQVRKTIARNLRIQKLVNKATEGVEPPTDEEVRAFYDENPGEFEQGKRARARHILLKTQGMTDPAEIEKKKEAAIALRERLVGEDAEDFAAVAEEASEGPSAPQGGDLGEFEPGQMVPEFDAAVFSMEPGEISEPVKTDFGYHLIKLESKTDAGTVPFEEAKEKIANYLTLQKQGEKVREMVAELKSAAEIETPQG